MTAINRANSAIADKLPTTQLYTADEVSAMTKDAVKASWLEKKARQGEIPARKMGRSWRWNDDDIRALHEYCRSIPHQRSGR